jgi:hypothetical protein
MFVPLVKTMKPDESTAEAIQAVAVIAGVRSVKAVPSVDEAISQAAVVGYATAMTELLLITAPVVPPEPVGFGSVRAVQVVPSVELMYWLLADKTLKPKFQMAWAGL